ncbi:MAG: flagellar filament capping protein FliD [Candidatus Brocadiia bacterium]
MSSTVSVDGLISGFDTSDIIDKAMAVERREVTLLEAREARADEQLTAFRMLNTQLLAVLSDARSLARPSSFAAKTVSVSDEDALTATAARTAVPGTYSITINSLARAHQVASQGYADTDSTSVGSGTLQIQVGDGETVTIDVDASNNTLAGLRDAINASDAAVTASIIYDGSDAVPYRLLLTADATGADNEMAITADLTGGEGPDFGSTSISDVVAHSANTYSGAATTSGTYTGSSNESYLVEIVTGGGLGEAEYRVSEDGGQSWGSTYAMPGDGAIDVYDDAHGTDLGVNATFGAGTFAAGDRFTIDAFVPTVQEPADAQLVVGSGDGQITISSESNSVDEVLPGLTLGLRKADPAESIEVQVATDTETIQGRVQSFVDHYNAVVDFIREQTRYDAENDVAGVLLGNTSVIKVQTDLRSAVLGTVPGLPSGSDGLYALGISVSATGRLSLDSAELAAALEDDPQAVADIFRVSGESTHAGIRFVAATGDTQATTAGYRVAVSQAATRGRLEGASIADPAVAPLTIDETNDKLVLCVNGVSSQTMELAHKTYHSGAELASELAAKIAADANGLADVDVQWIDEGDSGYFRLQTAAYGSGRSVTLGDNPANSAASVLGLADGTSTEGQDVAGTIDGFAAEGTGRILEATSTYSDAQGLRVEVAMGEDEVGEGASALVTVVKGVAKQAQDLLTYLTDPVDGYVKSREDRYSDQVERYRARIERMEELLANRRERLAERFAALEQSLASLRSQEDLLNTQLAALTSWQSQSRR